MIMIIIMTNHHQLYLFLHLDDDNDDTYHTDIVDYDDDVDV